MSESEEKVGPILASLGCLSVVFIPFAVIWEAFVVAKIWLWFIVPAYELEPLSIPTTAGILLLVNILKARYTNKDTRSPRDVLIYTLSLWWFAPGMYLLVAWIIKWWASV